MHADSSPQQSDSTLPALSVSIPVQRQRRSFLVALLLSTTALAARASQKFSFSGLQWGDDLDVVSRKLKAAGHSEPVKTAPSHPEALARDLFVALFSGQINRLDFEGSAAFEANRLISVGLVFKLDRATYSKQTTELRGLLESRYGKGRRGVKTDGNVRTITVWGYAPGETLELVLFGSSTVAARVEIDYRSPAAHRLAARASNRASAEEAKRRELQKELRAKEAAKF